MRQTLSLPFLEPHHITAISEHCQHIMSLKFAALGWGEHLLILLALLLLLCVYLCFFSSDMADDYEKSITAITVYVMIISNPMQTS